MTLGAVVQNLAIAAVMAGAVALACRIRRLGPAVRHALWLVVLVKLAVPPVIVLSAPWAVPDWPGPRQAVVPSEAEAGAIVEASRDEPESDVATATPGAASAASPEPQAPSARPLFRAPARRPVSIPWVALAGGLWLMGALVFASVQAVRIFRLGRLLRAAVPPDAALSARADRLARTMGLPAVDMRVVPGLVSPLVWATRRPTLLWPVALPSGLPDACLDGLLVHELAHVRRRDHWVSWLELAAGVVWWWNPLFWYVRSQVREHAELACDAWVIHALPHGRRAYAEALVAVCDVMSRRAVPVPAVGVSTGSRRVLERRLVMIMRGRVSSRLSRVGYASVVMLILATLPAWAQRKTGPSMPAPAVTAPAGVPPGGWQTAPIVTAPTPASRKVRTVPAAESPFAPATQALPADAQKLIDRFAEQQAEARREADAKIAAQRQDLIKQLQAMQETYTKAGRLDEAVAVRDRVRQLESPGTGQLGPGWVTPAPDLVTISPAARHPRTPFAWTARPTTDYFTHGKIAIGLDPGWAAEAGAPALSAFRDHVGESFTLPVIGATAGYVWGDGVYTDDSVLAAAAVHAGVVQPGKLGFARITILPGRDRYEGTTSHGVTSESFGAWDGSFRVERDPDPSPVVHLTGALDATPFLSLASFRGQSGVSFTAEVVGSDEEVWGTDVYTDDSSIGAAAVHAGLLKIGERGLVKITVLSGQEKYAGSDRNGVKSDDYGKWGGSFRLERVNKGGK